MTSTAVPLSFQFDFSINVVRTLATNVFLSNLTLHEFEVNSLSWFNSYDILSTLRPFLSSNPANCFGHQLSGKFKIWWYFGPYHLINRFRLFDSILSGTAYSALMDRIGIVALNALSTFLQFLRFRVAHQPHVTHAHFNWHFLSKDI